MYPASHYEMPRKEFAPEDFPTFKKNWDAFFLKNNFGVLHVSKNDDFLKSFVKLLPKGTARKFFWRILPCWKYSLFLFWMLDGLKNLQYFYFFYLFSRTVFYFYYNAVEKYFKLSRKWVFKMTRFGTIRELFEFFIKKRKFHMFPIIILLIALIGITALAQSGLVAFIYPI